MKSWHRAAVLVMLVVSTGAGCGPTDITLTKKPSYADLVVTYNAEVELLEKLESKRKTLISDHYAQAQQEAIRTAVSSIETGEAQTIPSDPNQALDRAVAAAEMQAQLQSGLVEGLGLSSNSEESEATYPEELKSKLDALDAEIADQNERVSRAKNARDASSPK